MTATVRQQHTVAATPLEARTPLERAVTAAGVGYYEWDPASGDTVVSDSLTELFGLPAGRPFQSTALWYDIVHPADRSRYRSLVERSTAEGKGWQTEFRIVRPVDGAEAWVEERASVGTDGASQPRSVIGLVWDITRRKRTEAALRESEERLRRTLEIETISVLFFNIDGRITDANGAFLRMTGYTREDGKFLPSFSKHSATCSGS